MPFEKKVYKSLALPPKVWRSLDRVASKRGVKTLVLIRMIVEEWLEANK